jgi:hypothetical protein
MFGIKVMIEKYGVYRHVHLQHIQEYLYPGFDHAMVSPLTTGSRLGESDVYWESELS